jgi:4,5-DOPA dioxygenase extradiol
MTKSRMPAVFFGHGNPMNALQDNAWTRAWNVVGATIARPRAILCISAHWYFPGLAVTAHRQPPTIHDFGGFPEALFRVQYPAPGSPELAARVAALLDPLQVSMDQDWGLDHGTWAVLCQVYPAADIPIVQLSLDSSKPPSWHFDLARRLAPLRDEEVLIVGSGNLVHNLHAYSWGRHPVAPYDWALRFEALARKLMSLHDFEPLIDYEALGPDALLAAPTPDHYLPLLYVLAQHREGETVSFPVEGFDGGSISMLSVQVGDGTSGDAA